MLLPEKTDWHKYQKIPLIYGAGGGSTKGSGEQSGSAPTQDPDTLVSKQFARIIDVWSEGEIDGWTHPDFPLLDVYYDGTVVQNSDASAIRTDGQVTNGSQTFKTSNAAPPFTLYKKSDGTIVPTRSPMVGRWINEVGHAHVPWGSVIISVEDEHSCTLSRPAILTSPTVSWQLGGTLNFKGVQFQTRFGTESQLMLAGWPDDETSTQVGVRIFNAGNRDWSHVFADTSLDGCRIDISIPQLEQQDITTGDVHGTSVRLQFFVNNRLVADDIITGKASSQYVRSYKLDFTPYGTPRTVRVHRVTPDSNDQALQNETWVQSFTEVTYVKLGYPNTAYIGLVVPAQQFAGVPARAYHTRGVKVKIPSNYDPETRIYTGVWDGTFAAGTAWTDNPAWCWYDMATNTRYGLGNLLAEESIDKWTLYTIGQYCDEMVNDGFGGLEPRFTCNLYIQRHEDAIKVLQDMAGIFRGMLAWINGTVTPTQDAPTDPQSYRMFSPANVVNGQFSYSGVGLRARHNVAVVSWSDLSDTGAIKQEYVEDHEALAKVGAINQLEVTGFGCTSRGQARRIGLWSIYSEKILTDTVTFQTGLEGYFALPGTIISVQDPFRAGDVLSGRLLDGATTTHLYLDKAVTLRSGITYSVSLLDTATGLLITKNVTTAAGTWSDIDCSAFGFTPEKDAVWQLTASDLVPELFRVLSGVVKEDNIIEITALQYNASLYDFVDFDHPLEEPPISRLPPAGGVLAPTNFEAEVIQIISPDASITQDIEIAWDASLDPYLARYRPTYRVNNGNWLGVDGQFDVGVNGWRLSNVQPGTYDFKIYAINTIGVLSDPLNGDVVVVAPPTNVTGVTGLELFGQGNDNLFQTRDAHFVWRLAGTGEGIHLGDEILSAGVPDSMVAGFDVEFYNDNTQLGQTIRTQVSEYTYTWDMNKANAEAIYGAGSGPLRIFRIEVRVVFSDGSRSDAATLTVENPIPAAPTDIVFTPGNGYVAVQWTPPADPDIDHYGLFASTDPNTNDPDLKATFAGNDTSGIWYLDATVAYHYWLGAIDTFGSVSANVPLGIPPSQVVTPPTFDPPPGDYIDTSLSVTINETAADCTIYWAVVAIGTLPNSFNTGTVASIPFTGDWTLWAIAQSNANPSNYAYASGDYHLSAPLATPHFVPLPGFYTVIYRGYKLLAITTRDVPGQSVYLYVTIDGTDPTPTHYDYFFASIVGQLLLTEDVWDVRAIAATADGSIVSPVMQGTYTIVIDNGPACTLPTFTPDGGNIQTFPVNVTLHCDEPSDAAIRYTIDGQIPSQVGAGVSRANDSVIALAGPCFLKAIAYRRGRAPSDVKISEFLQLRALAPPTFVPPGGEYTTYPVMVSVVPPFSPLGTVLVNYTLDGSIPTPDHGTLYTGPIAINNPATTLRAVCYGTGFITSAVTSALYLGLVPTPEFDPDSIFYDPGTTLNVTITLTNPPLGVAVYVGYTLDGTKPSQTNGTQVLYNAGSPPVVAISGGHRQLQALAYVVRSNGLVYVDSAVKSAVYDWRIDPS